MIFSGKRSGDKNTIHHYFPKHNKSFLIFEIFKNRYYSILVKRTVEADFGIFIKFDHGIPTEILLFY